MTDILLWLYLLLPIVFSGTFNMIFVKSSFLNNLKTPMDRNYCCSDGKRLFGANKTWKGFLGMIILTAISLWFFEQLAKNVDWAMTASIIDYRSFTFPFNGFFWGALWGLAYVLAELPNSYIKRRIDIDPGKNVTGFKGFIFTIADQADSIIGSVICIALFHPLTMKDAMGILITGTLLHLVVNMALFSVGLKKQWR